MASIFLSSNVRTVDEIFTDYRARRKALVRALTYDFDNLYSLCNPEKEDLCLHGHPDESWEVTLPAYEFPPKHPQPTVGINIARNWFDRKGWLKWVAEHCDSWLLSVAFYFGVRLNRNERERLLGLINDLPTVREVVTRRKHKKDKPTIDSGSKSRSSSKRSNDDQMGISSELLDDSNGEDDEEHSKTLCGSCGGNYKSDEFWICCDICEKWFHGKCVKITPVKADSIKQYKCPSCKSKRGAQ